MPSSTLLSVETPFLSQTSENPESRIIAGFSSNSVVDRHGDRVDPQEFNLKVFRNSPIVLLNHQFIKEQNGVDSAAGLVKGARAAYLKSENPQNSQDWLVHAIEGDEFLASFPKSQVPSLGRGDRGLFVIAEIFHPVAVEKIDRGEVGAFSWKGSSHVRLSPDGVKNLIGIDLQEITVTQIGANHNANFVVIDEDNPNYNREISIKSCVPYKLKFSKEDYDEGTVKEYIKKLHPTKQISETEDNYYIQLTDASDVDQDLAFNYTKQLVAAPMKMKNIVTKFNDSQENKMSQDQTVASTESRQSVPVRYGMVNIDALKMLVPSLKVQENIKNFTVEEENATLDVSVDLLEIPQEAVNEAIEQSLAVDTTPVVEDSIEEDSTETVSETEVTEPVQEETPVEDAKDTKIAELESKLEVLIQGMNTMVQNQAKEAEQKAAALEAVKQAKIEAEKQQAAKSAQEFEQLKSALFNSIPQQPVREEKVDSAKSFQTQNTQLSNEVLGDAAMAYFFNKNIDAKGAF